MAWSAKNRQFFWCITILRLVFDLVKALEPIECCRQLVLYPYVTILNPYIKIIYNICLIFFINASLQNAFLRLVGPAWSQYVLSVLRVGWQYDSVCLLTVCTNSYAAACCGQMPVEKKIPNILWLSNSI